MRNRAKCKKCKSVIESYHSTDIMYCACGEIYVEGGEALKCGAGDFSNFMRVDDKGNELEVKVVEEKTTMELFEEFGLKGCIKKEKPKKQELVKILEEIVNGYEKIPQHGLESFCTNYDMYSCLMVILQIFKSDTKNE